MVTQIGKTQRGNLLLGKKSKKGDSRYLGGGLKEEKGKGKGKKVKENRRFFKRKGKMPEKMFSLHEKVHPLGKEKGKGRQPRREGECLLELLKKKKKRGENAEGKARASLGGKKEGGGGRSGKKGKIRWGERERKSLVSSRCISRK